MDEELRRLFTGDLSPGSTRSTNLRIKEDGSGQIEIDTPEGMRPYTLKPLPELYGQGRGGDASVDAKDPHYQPLLRAIEEEIVLFHASNAWLTDGAVAIALGSLAMGLEAEQTDPLARRVQAALRLALSLGDYSRQEVRQALRYVNRSVDRHKKAQGPRGYLQFIRQFFPNV